MKHTRSEGGRPRFAARWTMAVAVAASAAFEACSNGSDRGPATFTAAASRDGMAMTCENGRGPVFPTLAELTRSSTIVVTARATTSRPTIVTAPLSTVAPKAAPGPTVIPPDDRRNDPALQGRGYDESYFTDTTIEVESVLKGPPDFVGRTITNRTNGDDIHQCTAIDPPPTRGTSQLFFLTHDPVSDTYFTTTGSLTGRFEIRNGRIATSGQPNHAQDSPATVELTGKTIAQVRSLI